MSALTLACVCPGDVNASLCTPTGLFLNLNTVYTEDIYLGGTTGAIEFSTISSSLGAVSLPLGSARISLPLSWLTVWSSITMNLGFDASTTQPQHFPGATFQWQWNLETDLLCTNPITGDITTQKIFSENTDTATNECVTTPFIRSIITAGSGAAFGSLFISTPLGACNGTSVSVGNFEPNPNADQTLDTSNVSGDFCLCASGGTAPYRYFLSSGTLPCGQSFDGMTGCLTGSPDGTCVGSESLTFGVIDAAGAQASVTCILVQHCGTGPQLGNIFY